MNTAFVKIWGEIVGAVAWDEKAGAVGSVWDVLRDPRSIFKVEVTAGIREDECAQILKEFFSDK